VHDPTSKRGVISLSLSSYILVLGSYVRGDFPKKLTTLDFHSLINFYTFSLNGLGEFTLHTPIPRP